MNDIAMVAAVIGLVANLRKTWPAVDGGMRVIGLTMAIATIMVFAYGGSEAILDAAKHALRVALEASGVMAGVNYGGTKLGEGMAKATNTIPPPAQNSSDIHVELEP